MGSLVATKSVRKPRPYRQLPDVAATGTLVTGEGLADLFRESAVLTIHAPTGESLYWMGCQTADGRIVALTLRKFGTGELYQITYEHGTFTCSCPDSTMRRRQCKHISGVHSALCRPQA